LHLVGAYWLWAIGPVPYLCVALIEAGWFGLFAVTFTLLCRRTFSTSVSLPTTAFWCPLLFGALWVVFEWLRSLGAYAFPWFPLAASQVPQIPLLQIGAVTGQWGLSFLIAWAGAIAGNSLRTRNVARGMVPIGVMILVLGLYGFLALAKQPVAKRTLTVAVAQGAYSGDYPEESLHIYLDLARDAVRDHGGPLDLIVCPESTYWQELLRYPDALHSTIATVASLQTPLLLGTDDTGKRGQRYNSAILTGNRGQVEGVFHKIKIVPLGEFFPFREALGPIYVKYPTGSNDLTAGEKPGLLTIHRTPDESAGTAPKFGTLICYESAFGWRARQEVRAGAEFLTVITNDAWFGVSAGPIQHADLSCLRAVETGRWVARAATSGESRIIDSTGKIVRSIPLMEHATAVATLTRNDYQTFYVRFGDWFVAVCGGIVLIGAVVINRKR
jgi:apolipoprotein N-acyltransferase